MNQTFVPTDAQTVIMHTLDNTTDTLFWPIQLFGLLVIFVAYRRFPRPFMLLLLVSHVFSLVHHGLTDSKMHCWIMNTFHIVLSPTTVFVLFVWGSVAWFFYYATRLSAIALCAWYLIRTRKEPNSGMHGDLAHSAP